MLESQPPAQPHSRVAVERTICFAGGADTEVIGPSAQRAVQLSTSSVVSCQLPARSVSAWTFSTMRWVPSHPPLRIARQCHLQSNHCSRQRADRRASNGDGSVNRARQRRHGHRCWRGSSPAMPLLRRSHDHCRELRARRPTARSAVVPGRGQNRDTMTPVTALSHCPPAGEPRFRRRTAVAPPPLTGRPMPSIRLKSPRRRPPQRQTRHRDRRSAANYAGQRSHNASRRPIKSP